MSRGTVRGLVVLAPALCAAGGNGRAILSSPAAGSGVQQARSPGARRSTAGYAAAPRPRNATTGTPAGVRRPSSASMQSNAKRKSGCGNHLPGGAAKQIAARHERLKGLFLSRRSHCRPSRQRYRGRQKAVPAGSVGLLRPGEGRAARAAVAAVPQPTKPAPPDAREKPKPKRGYETCMAGMARETIPETEARGCAAPPSWRRRCARSVPAVRRCGDERRLDKEFIPLLKGK